MKEVNPTKGLESNNTGAGENADQEVVGADLSLEILQAVAESNSITAVALMRLYDVLMCLYAETNMEDARDLANLHAKGKLRSQIPWLDLNEDGFVDN